MLRSGSKKATLKITVKSGLGSSPSATVIAK